MKVGIAIQCHDNSTRFYRKSVRTFFSGKSILEIILRRLKPLRHRIFVITTKNSPKTIAQAKKQGATVFIDRPKNLADSYLKLCVVYNLDAVVRICADNPFLQLSLLHPIMVWGLSGKYDYVAFERCMLRHEGFWAEFINASALYKLGTKCLSAEDKEHCTKYIYEHPDEFNLLLLRIPPILNDIPIRLTVDTKQDFFLAKRVYKRVKERNFNYIVNFIKRNYGIRDLMKKYILDNPKNIKKLVIEK